MTALLISVWVAGIVALLFWRYWWHWEIDRLDVMIAPLWPIVIPLYWVALFLDGLVNGAPLLVRNPPKRKPESQE